MSFSWPRFDLVVGVGAYFVGSLGGVAIVKYLNYNLSFTSWWWFALVSRSTWILAMLLHYILQCWENVRLSTSNKQLRLYALIALGLSIVELLNSLSMSMLPGSLYALLKGTDVSWSMSLSYLVLGKTYSRLQMLAAILIMSGVAVVFLLGPSHAVHDENLSDKIAAAGICVFAAFLNATCAVWTEATLKATLQQETQQVLFKTQQSPPSKLLLSNSYSMWTSLFAFGFLLVPETARIALNYSTLAPPTKSNHGEEDETQPPTPLSIQLVTCLLLIGISRFVERISKHWICVRDSAMTFSVVQAARRLLGVFILALLFSEPFPNAMVLGSVLSAIGFVLHWYGGVPPSCSTSTNGQSHTYELVSTSSSPHPLRH